MDEKGEQSFEDGSVDDLSAEWWYRGPGGDVYGPYTREEILRYSAEGRIDAAGRLRRGEHGGWVAPDTFPGLVVDAAEAASGPPRVGAPPTERIPPVADTRVSSTSRVAYILLGLLPFLIAAVAGIHNLAAGRIAAGATQLMMSLVLFWGFGCIGGIAGGAGPCLALPVWVVLLLWTIIDVVTVTTDGSGRRLAD